MTLTQALIVMAGGALGALLRYAVGLGINALPFAQAIPLATLLVNVSGCLVLGWWVGRGVATPELLGSPPHLFLAVGLLGAFTTMSTFAVETLTLVQPHGTTLALANIGLQLGLCLGGAWLGMRLAG